MFQYFSTIPGMSGRASKQIVDVCIQEVMHIIGSLLGIGLMVKIISSLVR